MARLRLGRNTTHDTFVTLGGTTTWSTFPDNAFRFTRLQFNVHVIALHLLNWCDFVCAEAGGDPAFLQLWIGWTVDMASYQLFLQDRHTNFGWKGLKKAR